MVQSKRCHVTEDNNLVVTETALRPSIWSQRKDGKVRQETRSRSSKHITTAAAMRYVSTTCTFYNQGWSGGE
jgi:hypothetical protein